MRIGKPRSGDCFCPNLLLELLRSGHFRFCCRHVWQLPISLQSRVNILAKQLLKPKPRSGRQQLESQISSFDSISFLGNQYNTRFSLNRDAAPENVNATTNPNRANIAPSIVPRLPRSPSDSLERRRILRRRPISSKINMPPKSSTAKSRGLIAGSIRLAPLRSTHSLDDVRDFEKLVQDPKSINYAFLIVTAESKTATVQTKSVPLDPPIAASHYERVIQ